MDLTQLSLKYALTKEYNDLRDFWGTVEDGFHGKIPGIESLPSQGVVAHRSSLLFLKIAQPLTYDSFPFLLEEVARDDRVRGITVREPAVHRFYRKRRGELKIASVFDEALAHAVYYNNLGVRLHLNPMIRYSDPENKINNEIWFLRYGGNIVSVMLDVPPSTLPNYKWEHGAKPGQSAKGLLDTI